MPSPPPPEGHPCPRDEPGSRLGTSLGPGVGACAARATDTPTTVTKAHHNRQRLGKAKPHRRPIRLEGRDGTPCPKGAPQRAQTIRPARLRSAFTAQLPQLGQAIGATSPQTSDHADTLQR